MTTIRALILVLGMTGLSALAFPQNATVPRIAPSEAKDHRGETMTVCGKVVDTKVSKYGISGHGKPVTFDLDQPEPNPVFYFVTFAEQGAGPDEALAAYKDKRVCVTGKITMAATAPFIMAADRSAQIKLQAQGEDK